MGRAQLILTPVSPAANPGAFVDNYSGSLSEVFTVNQSVSVTSVGYWDVGSDGVQGSAIKVAVFYASGVNMGQVVPGTEIDFTGLTGTLTGGAATYGGVAGEFRVSSLASPVTLLAGADYAIVAQGSNLDGYANGVGVSVANFNILSGALTLNSSGFDNSAGPGFRLPADGSEPGYADWLAGTFSASAIPEPSTQAAIFGVIALGAAGMCGIRRRRAVAA